MTLSLHNYWSKIKVGDEKSFELLFKELFTELCSYALQYTADRFLAEEIVQDVFIKIWQNREDIAPIKSIKGYIFQSVHNSCINCLIKKKNKKNIYNIFLSDESWEVIQESTQINSFLLEKLEAQDTEQIIRQIIQTLPAGCGEIFKLSRFENKSNQEIAEQLNVSISTVRTQIYRALEKISEGLLKIS
jgi:RNA polymerase sigma-70 factor, ECF subfamily